MSEQFSDMLKIEWQTVCTHLEKEQGNKLAMRLLKRVVPKTFEENEVCLSVPTTCIHEFIKQNYADQLLSLWKKENPQVMGLKFQLAPQQTPVQPKPKLNTSLSQLSIFNQAHIPSACIETKSVNIVENPLPTLPDIQSSSYDLQISTVSSENIQAPQPTYQSKFVLPRAPQGGINEIPLEDTSSISCFLDAKHTFETFVVGKSNEFAYAAARRVAEDESVSFNPLYIHAQAGLGKTHLMHAIAWYIKDICPDKTVLYLSSEQFFQHFMKALRYHNTESFHNLFRNVDVLMIDDVQFIFGKKATQEEFFHTFNSLIARGKKIILSADSNPLDLQDIDDRLKTRIAQGLVVNIKPTSFELRLGILQEKTKSLKTFVPDNVLHFLAKNVTASVRELEGALKRVVARAELIGTPINVETTKEILSDILQVYEKQISIQDILAQTADYYNLKLSDLKSTRRDRKIVRPRQLAMHLAKTLTPLSLPDIGAYFDRDHTTIMHAIKTIDNFLTRDAQLKKDMENIIIRLKEGSYA